MTETAYTLLDFGDGMRLEQWGEYRLARPDPTAAGRRATPKLWDAAGARYEGEKGRGRWVTRRAMPECWPVAFDDLKLAVRLTPFKHTGVFPEQAENWRWMRERAQAAGRRRLNVLNLFAYTGGATVALAKDGHFVTHVDAAKPSIGWAKENALLNGIPADGIRWMHEDAPAFVARERRRGKTYDGIVLDPPAFGHSPTGKTWRVDRGLGPLLADCRAILAADAAFVVLNGYARQDTPAGVRRVLVDAIGGNVVGRELMLRAADGRELSTGVVARCELSKAR